MSKAFPITIACIALGVSVLPAQQVPTVALGRAEATYVEPFTLIGGLRELPGGKVLVIDPRDKVVEIVDLGSGSATKIGREGSGPGEYQFPRSVLAMPNNESFVVDPMQSRMLRIDAAGKVIETVSYPGSMGPGMQVVGADAQGRIYWEGSSFGGGGGPMTFNSTQSGEIAQKDSVPVIRWDRRANKIDTLLMVKGPQMKVNMSGGQSSRSVMIRTQPFTSRDGWGVAPDGRVAVARSAPYRVDVVSAAGRRQVGTPVGVAALPLTSQDQQEYLKAQKAAPRMMRTVGGGGGAAPPAPPEPSVDDYEWPATKPFFDAASIRVSPIGELWSLRSRPAGDAIPVYDVFGVDGKLVRRVTFPAKTRLVGFGDGTIYVARSDDDDLQYLERYRDCGTSGCDGRGVRLGR
jgi:hypothetical protein